MAEGTVVQNVKSFKQFKIVIQWTMLHLPHEVRKRRKSNFSSFVPFAPFVVKAICRMLS